MKTETYIIVKDIDESPCEHPDCERFHQRFMERGFNDERFHMTKRTCWLVIDTRTGDQANRGATLKEAKLNMRWLNADLKRIAEQEKTSNSNINQEED